jgi:HSP20 family protein
MSVTTWSPFREMETLRERMDKLFADANGLQTNNNEPTVPALDVQETDDTVVVTASVPGFKPEDLTVEINKGMLSIRGENKTEREEAKGTWHLHERHFGSIQRAITLPASVSDNEAKATLADGVLTITIPKSERTPTRKIEIEHP